MLIKISFERVENIFQLKDDLFFRQGLNSNLFLKSYFHEFEVEWKNFTGAVSDHVYRIKDGEIQVYDNKLNPSFKFNDARIISGQTGIYNIEDFQIMWSHGQDSSFASSLCHNSQEKSEGQKFRYFTANCIVRYPHWHERVSNFEVLDFDGNVLFDHDLDAGYDCDSRQFYFWNDQIFYIQSNKKSPQLIGLDATSGEMTCKIEGRVTGFFDNKKGRIINLNSYGKDSEGKKLVHPYGVVDLNDYTYRKGVINSQFETHHISGTNQKDLKTVSENKFYFTNNRYYEPSQFGILNLDTMQIENLITLPEKTGVIIKRLIFVNDHLFVHTSTNKLLVYIPESAS